ncbi:hypothetical protein J1TS3_05490 [Siminovitchia fordii]|uniref:IstB-like ATP-binding protein domain-containing protein n=1 Tax=Siminovitchia fordii TaxID=254759 RepID=A0ABQ4K347_9BACI|nr:hypothetical protein J1TS3_05490 [Siminovitchia fordii]
MGNGYDYIDSHIRKRKKLEKYLRKSQLQLKRIRGADLVIIDDLMYMAMDQNEDNLLVNSYKWQYLL